MRSIIKPIRGQIVPAIIAFAVVVITVLLLAPILVKIVFTPTQKFIGAFSGMGNVSTDASLNKSVTAMTYAQHTFTSTFDYVLAFLLLFNILLLMLTSFLVDVHPLFFVVYLVTVFFLVIFAPSFLYAIDAIWTNPAFNGTGGADTNIVQFLPIMGWIVENYNLFLLGIIILSGLIMFGKYRFSSGSRTGGSVY